MCSLAAAAPTTAAAAPTAHDPHNYNFAMQKYLLLQEQHAELSTHLEQMRPRHTSLGSVSLSSMTSSSDSLSPPSEPPAAARPYYYYYPSTRPSSSLKRCRTSGQTRCFSSGSGSGILDTIPDEETMQAISTEEQRLFDVNESIKRALTEMLNCDTVRRDSSIRMWTQTRLMETEKELRSGRRRRSSPCRR